jgi:hypothetical protein
MFFKGVQASNQGVFFEKIVFQTKPVQKVLSKFRMQKLV